MKKLLLTATILAAFCASASAECYSDGIRVGSLQKFSKKGYVTKSWEGEIVMEGTKIRSTGDGGVRGGNVWAFSVTDPAVAKVVEEAFMSGAPAVTLKYCQANPLDITRGLTTSTSYIVTQAVVRTTK